MKLVAGILGVLVLLALVLALSVLGHRARRPWPDCTGRIEIVKRPNGRPLECVCVDRVIATCFAPGP